MFISFRLRCVANVLILTLSLIFNIMPVSAQSEREIFLGNPSAPITIVEYGSLTCGYCVRFHRKDFPKIATKYIDTGRAKFIFRDYPTSEPALRGATAARCAGDQYYIMLDHLFKHVAQWSKAENVDAALVDQASTLGLSRETFNACLSDPARQAEVVRSQQQAKTQLGVTGTPTFLINGKLEHGIRSFKELDAILEATSETP